MSQLEKVIIDADVCINLSRYEKVNALRCVLENIAKNVYVHEYVLQEELLSSACSSEIKRMVEQSKIKSLSPDKDLSDSQKANYHAACDLLADAMGCVLSEKRCEHIGEVLSVAIAKTLGIHIFLSNEWALQKEIDDCMNTGLDDIRVFRMRDIILWIKENQECGLSRKDAKRIWLLSFNKSKIDHKKTEFDILWPV
jgi:hypothetical protein